MSRRPRGRTCVNTAAPHRPTEEDDTPPPRDQWFLSFDCATKSFAFALVRVRLPGPAFLAKVGALAAAVRAGDGAGTLALAQQLDDEARAFFHLEGGGAADLVPGTPDKEIHTVPRVAAVVAYLGGAVAQALEAARANGCPAPDSPALNVPIEFQMAANFKSRAVAVTLLTYYAGAHCFLVGPALKNKVWFPSAPRIRHCFYAAKYKNLYNANKHHSRDLYFEHLCRLFGHAQGGVPAKIPRQWQADFADAVTQVLGFLAFGDQENAAERF